MSVCCDVQRGTVEEICGELRVVGPSMYKPFGGVAEMKTKAKKAKKAKTTLRERAKLYIRARALRNDDTPQNAQIAAYIAGYKAAKRAVRGRNW